MEPLKRNSGPHVPQEPHSEDDCKINDSMHSHPSTDCGHRVDSGPSTENTPDLNTYDEDHGKRCIVAGMPDHNLDQDPENGPGIKA